MSVDIVAAERIAGAGSLSGHARALPLFDDGGTKHECAGHAAFDESRLPVLTQEADRCVR